MSLQKPQLIKELDASMHLLNIYKLRWHHAEIFNQTKLWIQHECCLLRSWKRLQLNNGLNIVHCVMVLKAIVLLKRPMYFPSQFFFLLRFNIFPLITSQASFNILNFWRGLDLLPGLLHMLHIHLWWMCNILTFIAHANIRLKYNFSNYVNIVQLHKWQNYILTVKACQVLVSRLIEMRSCLSVCMDVHLPG